MADWQPIETAPKSNFILVCEHEDDPLADFEVTIKVVWAEKDEAGNYQWALEAGIFPNTDRRGFIWYSGQPTHWMPLPEPPIKEAKDG